MDYVRGVYPGFSWYNLHPRRPRGQAARVDPSPGRQLLLDAHLDGPRPAGADKLYVAMFDEVNQGTATFKCTDKPPVGKIAKFIDMDGKPSDQYLWLTGEAAKVLQKKKPLSTQMPTRE